VESLVTPPYGVGGAVIGELPQVVVDGRKEGEREDE